MLYVVGMTYIVKRSNGDDFATDDLFEAMDKMKKSEGRAKVIRASDGMILAVLAPHKSVVKAYAEAEKQNDKIEKERKKNESIQVQDADKNEIDHGGGREGFEMVGGGEDSQVYLRCFGGMGSEQVTKIY